MARPASDLSPRIVAAAAERFLREGVDGASLRMIARDAGTSVGMVYYYFPTKDDLFLAVVEGTYHRLVRDITEALAPDAPVDARIRRLYARLGAMTDEESRVIRLVVREALVSSERLEKLLERASRGHLPVLLAALHDGVAEGTVDAAYGPAAVLMAVSALAVAPQIAVRRVASAPVGDALPAPDALARALAELVLRGLAPRR